MYKEQDIREILEPKIVDKEHFIIEDVMKIVKDFVGKFKNDEAFRCVFFIDEFEDACVKKGIWNIVPDAYYADEADINHCFELLTEFLQGNILSEDEKRELAYSFIYSFIENSDDDCGCEHRVYIIIENLGGNGSDYVEEFNDYDEATNHAQETYEGMLDDEILAENIWFPIMCQLQNYEYDELKNYSTIIKMDASGLEELRNSYNDGDDD